MLRNEHMFLTFTYPTGTHGKMNLKSHSTLISLALPLGDSYCKAVPFVILGNVGNKTTPQ